jgi:hypothetical protein
MKLEFFQKKLFSQIFEKILSLDYHFLHSTYLKFIKLDTEEKFTKIQRLDEKGTTDGLVMGRCVAFAFVVLLCHLLKFISQ